MSNVNDHFFDGYYKDIWKTIIPAELTVKEVDFMLPYFQLQPGSKVLDLMCGYGRHALALAEKGIAVTAVDNLDEYVAEVKKIAKEKSLSVNAIKANAATYIPEGIFELAICMGNSLNFFPANELKTILKNTASHLQPGGHLLINSWSIAEIAFKDFSSNSWSEINGIKFLSASRFLFKPTRFETTGTMIAADGSMETKTGIDYIYSIAELEMYLHEAGMQLKEVFSIPGRKKFTLGEPRAYIVAERIKM
jgi:2-polyprenyl-3-methyl-5-hydroxy-6-metoxy-1,4-benzoquinol methylase